MAPLLIFGRNLLCILGLIIILSVSSNSQELCFEPPIKLPASVNSSYEESLPLQDPSGKHLYFARSFHPANFGGKDSGHDIWKISLPLEKHKANNHLPGLNDEGANAVVGFNRNGDKVYLLDATRKWLGLKKVTFTNNKWSVPEMVPIPKIRNYGSFNGLYIHPSEGIILLSIQTANSRGSEDIFVVEKNIDGSWSEPVKLPDNINSSRFEISPFLTHDGTTLYFSREVSPGNADIFYCKRTENSWDNWSDPKPLNINSDHFDAYFAIYPDGNAYFVSNREEEMTDIYTTQIKENVMAEQPEVFAGSSDANGHIADQNQNYKIEAGAEKKLESSDQPQKSLDLVATTGNAMIFFDFASAEIMNPMQDLLDFLSSDLRNADGYTIELVGHADEMGEASFNQKLSEQRAKNVMQYLADQGVEKDKMVFKGLGETNPLESNQSEFGRRKNRRVEIILSKTN